MGQFDQDKKRTEEREPYKEDLKEPFLKEYRTTRTISGACKPFGLSRNTIYRWRQQDPSFNEKFSEIEKELIEVLEVSAYQRALKGSDVLTIFLLKSLNPAKYKDLVKHEVDHRFFLDVTTHLTTIAKKVIPTNCPHCNHNLAISNKFAAELEELSQRLERK